MSRILAVFDESGDLGWKFDAPYRAGGSSRVFVIAGVTGADKVHRRLGRVIKKLRVAQGWTSSREKKWANISDKAKQTFVELVDAFAKDNPDVRLSVAVLEKEKLPETLRPDKQLLYAHLATQLVADELAACEIAEVCPDELNAASGSANLLEHLMRHEVLFRRGCAAQITHVARQAHLEQALEFCDMLAGAAAAHFEDKRSEFWNVISPHVRVRTGC
jgi:hypothetical protein